MKMRRVICILSIYVSILKPSRRTNTPRSPFDLLFESQDVLKITLEKQNNNSMVFVGGDINSPMVEARWTSLNVLELFK